MAHDHHHHEQNTTDLKVAFALNLGFTLLELFGGLLINSVAILSDALHDLGDSLSLGAAWYLQGLSDKGQDTRYSYGYRRFSLLGALLNTIVLLVGSLFILSETIPRLLAPEPFNSPGMIGLAVVGIAVNGIAAYRLHGSGSSNERVVGLHLLEDVLGWVAVFVVGVVSLFVNLPILDPILSVLVTLYILVNVISRLRDAARLFLQGVPQDINLAAVESDLLDVSGVRSTHHVHLWSLDGEHHVFTAHLVVAEDTSLQVVQRIRHEAKQVVQELNLEHVTIAVEYPSEDCEMRDAG